jgi:glycosyltransferase involved in cell wall biosynthesis
MKLRTYPLVSVYIPTKNRCSLLERAVLSVLAQDYPNIELIIVDDGSTDASASFLSTLVKQHSNISVKRLEHSQGACIARNWAINHAKGEFVTGLDDDDYFLPHRISSLMAQYQDNYAFVCSSSIWDYGKRQKIIDSQPLEITLDAQLNYNEASNQILVKRERVLALGGFNTEFSSCQDYDLWTRLIIRYGHALRIAEPSYYINDTNSTQRMIHSNNGKLGYEQFLSKHRQLMSPVNLANQRFMQIRRLKQRLTLPELITQYGAGHYYSKLRYFLSSNFSIIKTIHSKYYKNK